MLQMTNGAIHETHQSNAMMSLNGNSGIGQATTTGYVYPYTTVDYWPSTQTIYWNSYPVYICTDKTKKAIEVLKALEADKTLKVTSVPKFIALVEKIAGLL